MVNTSEQVARLSRRLDDAQTPLRTHQLYYDGAQPLAYLAQTDADALKGRLVRLPVNHCRLVVDVLADRLRVEGFTAGAGSPRDLDLWRLWRRAGMVDGADQATRAALVFGRGPVSVWADPRGGARIRPEDPRQTLVAYNPATGDRAAALKRWHGGEFDQHGYGVLYLPDAVLRLRTASQVPLGGALPVDGWAVVETLPNPLGVVPVVELVNRPAVGSLGGVSEIADVEPLVDAVTKLASDMMVSAEFGARPRRFTLGVEIVVDDDGNPVNPFVDGPARVWQLEGSRQEAQVGQLDAAALTPYTEAISVLTHQIAAISQLPPAMVGIAMDQPASAEALRASESGLAARARARQRAFSQSWAEVVRLAAEVATGRPRPDLADVEPVWSDPETPTVAQAADAAAKLVAAGIVPVEQARDDLGYTPEQRAAMRTMDGAGGVADVAARAELAQTLQDQNGLSQPAALAAAGLFAAADQTRTDNSGGTA